MVLYGIPDQKSDFSYPKVEMSEVFPWITNESSSNLGSGFDSSRAVHEHSRSGALLCRFGTQEKRLVGADAVPRTHGAHERALAGGRLQPRVRGRQHADRWPPEGTPPRIADIRKVVDVLDKQIEDELKSIEDTETQE